MKYKTAGVVFICTNGTKPLRKKNHPFDTLAANLTVA